MPKPVSLVIPSKLPPDKCATEKHPDDPRVQVYDISSGSFAINDSQLVDHEDYYLDHYLYRLDTHGLLPRTIKGYWTCLV